MNKTFYFFILICGSFFAQLPDISFNGTNAWTTGSGISFNTSANQVNITGNGNNYVKTTLDATLTNPVPTDFYFYADVYLQNTTFNPQNIKNPQLLVRDNTGNVIYRFNIDESLQNTWFKAGIRITGYAANLIKVEAGVNSTTGTMQVKNPVLSTVAPSFTYEFPWAVPANVTTTLNVDTTQKHTFQNDLLSTNSHFVYAGYQWGDTAVRNAMSTYFPMSNMRFPGGTVGNYYNYSTDSFFANAYTPNNLQNIATGGYTFRYDGYKSFVNTSAATSTLMMNMITPTPLEAKAEYQQRYNGGLNIKWVELGNEMYLTGNQVGNVTDITSYISHTKSVVSNIKTINANAKFAVNVDKDDFTSGSWNETLSSQNYYDAGVLHNYNATGIYFFSKYASYAMLKFYKISLDRFTKFQTMFPGKPLLLTEWGITSEVSTPYFLEALGCADAFLAIEKGNQMGVVQQAGLHMLYKNDDNHEATLMYYNAGNLMLTSRGKMYSKLFEVFKNSEVYNAETVSTELETGLKAVNARMVKNGSSYKVFVVNKLPVASPLILNINGVQYTGSYTLESYTENMDVATSGIMASSNTWNPTSGTGSITLPASSINVVTLNSNPLAVDEKLKDENVSLFPNPAQDKIFLKYPNTFFLKSVRIYDVSGRKILEETPRNNKEINLQKLQKGIYMMRLNFGDKGIVTKPFIIIQ